MKKAKSRIKARTTRRENQFPLVYTGYSGKKHGGKIRLAMLDSSLANQPSRCAVCGRSALKPNKTCRFIGHRMAW